MQEDVDSTRNVIMHTREQKIIAKIVEVHGDKYLPDDITIPKGEGRLGLLCPDHGPFELRLKHLLKGSGCQVCSKIEKNRKVIENQASNFLKKAKEVHGDKYDYGQVDYKGNSTRVKIVCKIHGEFTQTPKKHREGSGCHKCGVEQQKNRLNTDTFIERARKAHGNKYDYSHTQFVDSKSKVQIKCKQHGIFEQLPHNHMKGAGCKKCADISITKTTQEFIDDARKVHGSKYSYEMVVYSGHKQHVDIVCKIHGAFRIRPTAHLSGLGCQRCSIEKRASEQAMNTFLFIEKANLVHDNRWSYPETKYLNYHKKVVINCREHGPFEQTPGSHLSGRGCPHCGSEKAIESRTLKFCDFIEKSNLVHNNEYIYSDKLFVSAHVPVEIECQKHGAFFQRPSSHMRGSGCPLCGYENSIVTRLNNEFDKTFGFEDINSNDFNLDEIKRLLFSKTANEVHQNFYDYSEVQLSSRQDTVNIFCPIHGHFLQNAERHLYGTKCPSCQETERRLQTEEFIKKAKVVHGDTYDYSEAKCNGVESIVTIICKKHGGFTQNAKGHLKGNGCRECYVESTRSNTSEFIDKCRAIHSDLYTYNKTIYTTARNSVIVTCKKHGDFAQVANDHRNGAGCPKCAEYYRNLDNRDPKSFCVLYYLKLHYRSTSFYKIGITTLSVEERFRRLSMFDVEIVEQTEVETTLANAIEAEQNILECFKDYSFYAGHILLEIGGGTECFSTDVLGNNRLELKDYL